MMKSAIVDWYMGDELKARTLAVERREARVDRREEMVAAALSRVVMLNWSNALKSKTPVPAQPKRALPCNIDVFSTAIQPEVRVKVEPAKGKCSRGEAMVAAITKAHSVQLKRQREEEEVCCCK